MKKVLITFSVVVNCGLKAIVDNDTTILDGTEAVDQFDGCMVSVGGGFYSISLKMANGDILPVVEDWLKIAVNERQALLAATMELILGYVSPEGYQQFHDDLLEIVNANRDSDSIIVLDGVEYNEEEITAAYNATVEADRLPPCPV